MNESIIACHIGIGANLGDARKQVEQAISQLEKLPDTVFAGQSSLFRTAPVDAGGDDYVNAVVRLDTRLTPEQLLRELQTIEQQFGRERSYRNAPRTLDLDILLYGQQTIASEELHVPHPRMTQRAFVLIPLLQLDPFITIPGQGPASAFVPAVAGQFIQEI